MIIIAYLSLSIYLSLSLFLDFFLLNIIEIGNKVVCKNKTTNALSGKYDSIN